MSMKKRGLGRGLEALLGGGGDTPATTAVIGTETGEDVRQRGRPSLPGTFSGWKSDGHLTSLLPGAMQLNPSKFGHSASYHIPEVKRARSLWHEEVYRHQA